MEGILKTKMDLGRLLRPRSIAVIGGGAWGAAAVRSARTMGFEGPVWPVHPARAEVAGVPAFSGLDALPGVPDAAFVAVNRDHTPDVLAGLRDMGAGGAVGFASGFAEDGAAGQARQVALLQAAGEMPVLGPNCYGLINALDGVALWPDRHGLQSVERGVAILSQSGNITLNLTMQQRGLPVAYACAAGNQAQIGLADLGAAMLEDERVTALGLHIEGIGDLRAYEALAALAEALGKPVIALKVGRSEAAQLAGMSHTASLAGSAAGAEAFLARLGIVEVRSLGAFLQALHIAHHGTRPSRLAAMSCSGGEAGLAADAAADRAIDCPALTPAQDAALRDVLGEKVIRDNPLDYHTYIWGDELALTGMITAMMSGDADFGVVFLDFPRDDIGPSPDWDAVVSAASAASRATGRAVGILASMADTMSEARARQIAAAGLIPLVGLEDAFDAIAALAKRQPPSSHPLVMARDTEAPVLVEEYAAKEALAGFGVAVPEGVLAENPDQASDAAHRLGRAVVLKGLGAAHKTEAGLVAVGLAPDAVRAQAEAMPARRFLVEEQITGGLVELLIGVRADPAHGFVLTLGAGGTLTEILADTAHLLVPASDAEVRAALAGLKLAPVLRGYRGKPPVDEAALLRAVMAVQSFVTAHADRLAELEINPLICTETTAVAADALITWGEQDD